MMNKGALGCEIARRWLSILNNFLSMFPTIIHLPIGYVTDRGGRAGGEEVVLVRGEAWRPSRHVIAV
jgi:hypothetical protein